MKNFGLKFFISVILLVGFFVYVNALPNGFVWDDEEQIVNNLVIRDWSNLPLIFTSSTFYAGGAGLSGGFYRPLVTLSYFLNYHIFGLDAFCFRLFQIFFHLLNLVLIFFILRKIFSDQQVKYGEQISFIATLLFAVHPANVESVIYAASVGEVLYTFFILLAFWFFIKNFSASFPEPSPDPSSPSETDQSSDSSLYRLEEWLESLLAKNKYFLLGFVFAFLGLLSKESAVVIFPLFAVYLLLFIKPKIKVWLNYILGSGLILGLYLFLRFFVAKIPAISTHFAPISNASFLERLETIPYEIFSYLRIIFFPKDLAISQHFVISSISDIRFWSSLVLLLAILSITGRYVWKTKSKMAGFFVFWFFGSLSPTLNVIPLDMTIAERWLYFPLIGILALFCFLTFQLKEKSSKFGGIILIVFIIIAILGLGIRTIIRNNDWKNGLTLYSHDIKYSKNAFDLENNYGVELFRAGRTNEAEEHFRKSIELQPKWTYPHNNLGAVLEKKGDLEDALVQYKKAVELSDYYLAYENLGGLLFKMGRDDEAKEFLEKSLLKFSKNANLKFTLALIYYKNNDIQKAAELFLSAFQDDPQNIKVRQILDVLLK